MKRDAEQKVVLAVLAGGFVNGTSVFLVKIGTSLIPQLPFVSTAILLSGLIMLVFSLASKKGHAIFSAKRRFPELIWIGVVGTSVPVTLIVYGLSFSGATSSVLLQSEVIFSIALGYVFLRERITREQIAFCFFSIFGAFLVLTNGVINNVDFGGLLLLLAPLFYQIAHVVAKGVLREIDYQVVVTYRLLLGGLTLTFVTIVLQGGPLIIMTNTNASIITVILAFGYAAGNTLWYYGVTYLNLSKATSLIVFQPLIPAILGIVLLGETLSAIKFIGIVIVFFSVLRLSRIRNVSR